ncbi:acetyltransferase-like protein [Oryza sativa Japonica Group]|uniref:Acetyltransferase-like protein n=1 Tax=Oryza sativa subsp. japonica TaxID=39947 RepID=Q5ZAK2_ORYSJ|nr:acetyltransferase-like protein [Oryza sativa Japonica Group]BAD53381.1 acetyltransferase-like protein [Oryza sativa Japonica Group]
MPKYRVPVPPEDDEGFGLNWWMVVECRLHLRCHASASAVAAAAARASASATTAEADSISADPLAEALVDVDNAASRRALEKAGFQQEAVLCNYCVVKGQLRDMVIYSFISTDPLVE